MLRLFTRISVVTLSVLMLTTAWFLVDVTPQSAQGAFATNTPDGEETTTGPTSSQSIPLFATNTPAGGAAGVERLVATPTVVPTRNTGPEAALFNYSLRQWLERDLVALAAEQVRTITEDDENRARALQVTLYELEQRYPAAPSDPQQRRDLIEAMLAAPIGSIDMRSVVRPLIEAELNRQPDVATFTIDAFDVRVTPANLDGRGAEDAVVQITAENGGQVLYDEFVLALGTGRGYRFVPSNYNLFAVPFNGLNAVVLRQITDTNRDSLDEVVLRVSDGSVNDRLLILGVRNEVAIELVPTGEEIRFARLVSWPIEEESAAVPILRVVTNQADSSPPNWPCVSQQTFEWRYERNLYRQAITDLNSRFERVDSLGCTLLEQEPLFALPPDEAATIVEEALLDYGFEAPGVPRALLTLAILYTLDGRLDDARNSATAARPADAPDSWATQQADALLAALGVSSNTALDICAALAAASPDPACDLNALLGRLLNSNALLVDQDLLVQLTSLGFRVADRVEVAEVGRATRTTIQFDLPQTTWWAFVPQRDGTYLAEPSETPASRLAPESTADRLRVPDAAFDALFLDDDPASALNIVSNVRGNNPDRPFTADGLYLLALSYDLTAAREDARQTYYDVWSSFPDTIWGQLAAEHLEQR